MEHGQCEDQRRVRTTCPRVPPSWKPPGYAGIDIPTLCYLKDVNEIGACRMCVVEVKGARVPGGRLRATRVNEGMEVFTNTPKVRDSRKMTLELLLSNHDKKCLSCVRSGNCELQTLCQRAWALRMKTASRAHAAGHQMDDSTLHLVRDNAKCILCRRCVAACQQVSTSASSAPTTAASTPQHRLRLRASRWRDVACVACGQCIVSCPTGASDREGQYRRRSWTPSHDPDQARGRRPDRPRRARRPGRGVRHAHRHQRGGQDGRRPAPPGL